MKRVCVFCGSNGGARPEFGEAALALGGLLAGRGLGLVYGGGNVGLMGLVADGALAAGGEVIGVIPERLKEKELAHRGATEMHVVDSLSERKQLMADLADGFVSLPGGMGTLDEMFEMLIWNQLSIHAKPCGLLNVAGYYNALLDFLQTAADQKFVSPEHHALLLTESDPNRLLDRMAAWGKTAE